MFRIQDLLGCFKSKHNVLIKWNARQQKNKLFLQYCCALYGSQLVIVT